jgi:hypothetical protein
LMRKSRSGTEPLPFRCRVPFCKRACLSHQPQVSKSCTETAVTHAKQAHLVRGGLSVSPAEDCVDDDLRGVERECARVPVFSAAKRPAISHTPRSSATIRASPAIILSVRLGALRLRAAPATVAIVQRFVGRRGQHPGCLLRGSHACCKLRIRVDVRSNNSVVSWLERAETVGNHPGILRLELLVALARSATAIERAQSRLHGVTDLPGYAILIEKNYREAIHHICRASGGRANFSARHRASTDHLSGPPLVPLNFCPYNHAWVKHGFGALLHWRRWRLLFS